MRQKSSRQYERHEVLAGVGSFYEPVWHGELVLARDGWTAGYWFQSEAVDTLRARRMAVWCFILEWFISSLHQGGMTRTYAGVT